MSRRRSSWTDSFRHAVRGVGYAIGSERHMRVHLAATVVAVLAGVWLRIGRIDWLWLGAAVTGVWTTELLNTAVERTVDLVSPERHPLAKAAKDAAAGAVMFAAAFAVFVALLILAPRLWDNLWG